MERLLTVSEIQELTGLSRTTIYRLRKVGRFPSALRVSDRAVRWPEAEVLAWLKSRPRTAA